MVTIPQNHVIEVSFTAKTGTNTPDDLEFNMLVVEPGGIEKHVPGFWAGDSTWRARYSSPVIGRFEYTTSCPTAPASGLHEVKGSFDVVPYAGSNPLYQHGRLHISKDKKDIEHADGTPFFWLGDTWWMGFTKRLHWPDDFSLLTSDRVKKGFTLVQIVAGLYPDMPPFDERGANEGGFPWDNTFQHINPMYFDRVDQRVQHLVNAGLVPCIVGFWGYFISVAGVAALERHWRYLVARYGAYPVAWCIAGEAMMRYYLDKIPRKDWNKHERPKRLAAWSRMAAYLRSIDSHANPITIHPTSYGHEQLDDPALLDVNMLQTGHANATSEIATIKHTVKMISVALKKHPRMPVVVGEVCYEGIMEANRQQVQRCLFWATMLSGGAGYTYGANGIWQVNRRDQPFGPSPHGTSWGEMAWEDAYTLPGSTHVGVGKAILEKYPWVQIEPHQEWVKGDLVFAAGIPRQLRIIYKLTPGAITVRKLEGDVKYQAIWVDPKNGVRIPIGSAKPNNKGEWTTPQPPVFQDWLVILERC